MLVSFGLECLALIFSTLFGMTLMPEFIRKDNDDSFILVAPVLGLSVWLVICLFLGFFIPYNKILLSILLIICLVFIFYRRRKIRFNFDRGVLFFILLVIISSFYVLFCVLPREINGGLYFTPSAFDHQRTAIINAIASTGIPPLNPYLSLNGVSEVLYYHFGFQALAAQYTILFGVDGLIAGAALNALTHVLVINALGFIVYKFTRKRISLFVLFVLYITSSAKQLFDTLLPGSNFMSLINMTGMWSNINDIVWTPHNMLAGIIVIVIIWLYPFYLKLDKKKELISMSLLLGIMAAASAMSSVYAGACALVLFVLAIIWMVISSRDFRNDFIRILPYQLLCIAIAIVSCLSYFLFLAQNSSSSPIEFGFLPFYEIRGIFDAIKALCHYYLLAFPINAGITVLFGVFFLFVPRIISDRTSLALIKSYVLVVLLAVFFIHSTSNDNDFGWRTITSIKYLFVIFSTVGICKVSEHLKKTGKSILLIFVLLLPVVFSQDIIAQASIKDTNSDIHKVFAKAVKGWDVIKENTSYLDLVTCNPEGFKELDGINPQNYLFGFYADRLNCIADNYYTLTSCKGSASKEEVKEAYSFVVKFFSGNPSLDDVNHMADDLKVKALLVTPVDGLWNNIGALKNRYSKEIEGDGFKAYFLK